MHWLYLFLAIIAETLGTTFLKMSNGFTQLFPSILAIALFCLALFLSAITLKYLAVGIVYAIWSAMGIAIVAIVSYFVYSQSLQWQAIIGLILVIAGVVLLNIFSSEAKSKENSEKPNRDSFMEMSDLNKNE